MDKYLDNKNVTKRLIKEWKKYNKIIIAYDFDSTIFDYHKEGNIGNDVIDLLKRCKEIGAYFIVFTARPESKYKEMKEYLINNNIPFDKINQNMEFIPLEEGRKIYFNILLDDRAGLTSAFSSLKYAANYMENYNSVPFCVSINADLPYDNIDTIISLIAYYTSKNYKYHYNDLDHFKIILSDRMISKEKLFTSHIIKNYDDDFYEKIDDLKKKYGSILFMKYVTENDLPEDYLNTTIK